MDPVSQSLLEKLAAVNFDEMRTFPEKNLNAIFNYHHIESLHEMHIARTHAERARHSARISDSAFEVLLSRVSIEKGKNDVLDHKMSEREAISLPPVAPEESSITEAKMATDNDPEMVPKIETLPEDKAEFSA